MDRERTGPTPSTAYREAILVLLGSTALTAWWLWPLPLVWRTSSAYAGADVPGVTADFYLIVWALSWDTHALLTAPWRLFHGNTFFPARLSLAYSEHFLGALPLFAPTYLALGNPILAINVLSFASYPLCVLAMYALARRWSEPPAAAVAAFLFAFSTRRAVMPPYVYLLVVPYLPLVFLFAERWFERGRRRDGIALGVALTLQLLVSVYLAYAVALAVAAYGALALWRWRHRIDRRRVVGFALATLAAVAVFAALSIPYLVLQRQGIIPAYEPIGLQRDVRRVGLNPYFASLQVWRYWSEESAGWVGFALAALAVAPPWRGRAWPASFGAMLVVLGTLLAFGPRIFFRFHEIWSPYTLLMAWLPGFSAIRLPGRFLVLTELGLAILAGLGAARLLARVRRRTAWLATVLILAAALATGVQRREQPLHAEVTAADLAPAYAWLAQHGGGRALLELPDVRKDLGAMSRRMFLSTFHWLPIVDGYSGYAPGTSSYIHGIGARLPEADALQELANAVDLGWILVHRADLTPEMRQPWEEALPPGLVPAGEWGSDLLLRVEQRPSDDRRGRLLSTTETLGGVPLAPLGSSCPGELQLLSTTPLPWPPRSGAEIRVAVRNAGASAWPGRALIPRHLVELRTSLVAVDDQPVVRRDTSLGDDLAPGGVTQIVTTLDTPQWPGDYTLVVELEQKLDGPLSRCGIVPLRIPVRVGAS